MQSPPKQLCEQAPQFVGSFVVATSQPLPASLSQSANPGLQVNPHAPATQVATPLATPGQGTQFVPQDSGLVGSTQPASSPDVVPPELVPDPLPPIDETVDVAVVVPLLLPEDALPEVPEEALDVSVPMVPDDPIDPAPLLLESLEAAPPELESPEPELPEVASELELSRPSRNRSSSLAEL